MNKNSEAELIQKKNEQVKKIVSQEDFFNSYIAETLNSFAYRYFDEANAPEVLMKDVVRVTALEKGIKEAIKIKNPELRAGIGELVKRVSREEGPTILREIRVSVEKGKNHEGTCQILARISFGHPDHLFSKGTYVEKTEKFKFEDEIHFRNILAKEIEKVCEVFG
jgi:hypothetical protein